MKRNEPGLQYMQEINIRPAKNFQQLYRALADKLGKKLADEFESYFSARADRQERGDTGENDGFYSFKNRNLNTALAVSGAFDGDILRQICNLIDSVAEEYKDCKRILEVGCDCGILSCFLGRTFPDATIVSIDRCAEGVAVARELAAGLNVDNVDFLQTDVCDLKGEPFDAIISVRAMHENYNLKSREDHMLLLDVQGGQFSEALADYAAALARNLAPNGKLLSIERCGQNPALYGWLLALNDQGIEGESHWELSCQEVGEESIFQILTFKKTGVTESKEAIRTQFCMCVFGENAELQTADFSGWEASLLLQMWHGDLIEGVCAFVGEEKVAKLALWESADCKTDILVEKHVARQFDYLYIRDRAMLDEIKADFEADKAIMLNEWNAQLKELVFEDGEERII